VSARLARWIVRLRWAIVVAWIAAATLVTISLPTIRQAQVGSLGDLVPRDAHAVDAERRSYELFGFPLLSRTIVVERDGRGLSPQRQLATYRRAAELNLHRLPGLDGIGGAIAVTNGVGRPRFAREHATTALTYLFFGQDIGQIGRTGLASRLVARHVKAPPGGDVGITGAIPARYEQALIIEHRLPLIELATVLLIGLAVGAYFRAPGAPLLALATVAIAYLVAIRVIAAIGEAVGVSVPSEVEPVIVVLLFGVITDYVIFFTSHFRTHVAAGVAPRTAAERTTAELLPIITTCGLTVAAGSAALVVARLGFFQAFGPGMAMAVLIALAVSITFVPAALSIAGSAVLWPSARRAPRPRSRGRSLTTRAVELAVHRPLPVVAACLAVLAVCASGMLKLDLGNSLIRGLPEDSGPRRAYSEASSGFAPGILSPTVVVVEQPGIVGRPAALARLQRELGEQPGVAAVVGPAQNPLPADFGAVRARNGAAARYLVILSDDPLGSLAIARLRQLRARMPALLREAGLPDARVGIAGDTALSEETISDAVSDLKRVIPAVLLAILVVLAVFLRGLVAPLYLVAASLLGPLAALGLATYVFGDIRGYGELTYFVPVAASVLLVALGSDYNVFLAGRVWEEARTRPLARAIVEGASSASHAIAAAGVVLAASFALLALVPVRSFRELAFVMGAGLLIDAFVVRTVLIPALIALVGARSGWPGRRLGRPGGPRPAAARAGHGGDG
jgi:putative drug exporter of the RND superfamily